MEPLPASDVRARESIVEGPRGAAPDGGLPPRTDPGLLSVREGYDRWSKIYDHDGNPLVAIEEQQVRAWVGDPRGLRVADIGCGTGRHASWLAAAGARVDGFDDSPGMLQQARHKLAGQEIRLHEHRLPEPLPVPDGSYDLILFALVADHVADLQAAFGDLRRATRAGGLLVFTVMHPALNLMGTSARFVDPERGETVYVNSCRHTCSDYVMAGLRSGWLIEEMVEQAADEQLAARVPRAAKYVGWPMLLAMKMIKPSG